MPKHKQVPYVDESKLPYVGGRDVAGWVEKVGSKVKRFHVGDEVFGLPGFDHGTFAEFCVVDEGSIASAPKSICIDMAGAVPLAGLTAWQGLIRHGQLLPGQRVLVHGGAGGTGHFAVQFAKALDASVTVTASAHDAEFLLDLGADNVVDYRNENFEELGATYDLVLDLVGGDVFDRSWSVLRPGGRLVSALRLADGNEVDIDGRKGTRYFTMPDGTDLAQIASLIDRGLVKVVVSETYPIQEVAAAQARLQRGGVRGKILISIAATAAGVQPVKED